MKVKIRMYQSSDRPSIVKCMEELQDYLVAVDQMKFTRRMSDYGEVFTRKLLKNISENNGLIYVAEHENRVIGFIAGITYFQSFETLLECVPLKSGRILELFVDSRYRGQNIGMMLTEKMEMHFKENMCDVSRVEVFEPNVKAHQFYRKLGYQDRIIDMIKGLRKL